MTDGPTFFGPEGVTKGKAAPVPQATPPAPPPKPAPEPERKTFAEVETAEAPRRMSGPMWAALLVLAAGGLAAGWFYTRPEAPKYDMNSVKAPAGRFHVTPCAFIRGEPGKEGLRLNVFAAIVGNATKMPQIASEARVQLIDDQERYYDPVDLEKLRLFDDAGWKHMVGDSSSTPINPGVISKRAWLFTLPQEATIRFAYIIDPAAPGAGTRIELWEKQLPAGW